MSLSRVILWGCALAGCAHRVDLPTTVHAPTASQQIVWVSAGSDVLGVDAPVIWFADIGGVESETPVCHASDRRGPLWQQMDVGGVRFICVANPNRLSKRRRLEQRFQAPMSASPTSGMPLVIAASLSANATSAVTDDLEAFSDALALQMRIRRGEHSELVLGESEWGPPTLIVGPDAPIRLTVAAGQTTAQLGDMSLTTGDLGQWVVRGIAD